MRDPVRRTVSAQRSEDGRRSLFIYFQQDSATRKQDPAIAEQVYCGYERRNQLLDARSCCSSRVSFGG